MENLIEIIRTDAFALIMSGITIILLIGFVIMIAKFSSLNKRYKKFMKKLGNGSNIEEDLENYMYRVDNVERQNADIYNQVKILDEDLTKCIQKVGIVRYSAFKDTGSDLSFALALLDDNNDGVVLNGIYSREMSNIYAKPVEKGTSTYTVSEEEAQAIKKAIDSNGIYKVK
jgi:hypothetical protein